MRKKISINDVISTKFERYFTSDIKCECGNLISVTIFMYNEKLKCRNCGNKFIYRRNYIKVFSIPIRKFLKYKLPIFFIKIKIFIKEQIIYKFNKVEKW